MRPQHYCTNIGGFIILIKPGIRLKLINFERHINSFDGRFYEMKFVIMDDIDVSQIIEYNDYIERGKISENNVLLQLMDEERFHSKELIVCISPPFDFFNFSTTKEPMVPKDILKEEK